jgi:phosphoglycolate phosphatase-like HAD superfamily hydrolase
LCDELFRKLFEKLFGKLFDASFGKQSSRTRRRFAEKAVNCVIHCLTNHLLTMKKLLLFDIDGTLVSVERAASRQLLRDVVRETLEIEIPADYTFQLGGKTDFQIMTEIATDLAVPLSIIDERRNFIKERLVAHTERIASEALVEQLAGVRELLDELLKRDDVTLGLLTGNIKQTAYLKLRPHGLSSLFPFGAFGCRLPFAAPMLMFGALLQVLQARPIPRLWHTTR